MKQHGQFIGGGPDVGQRGVQFARVHAGQQAAQFDGRAGQSRFQRLRLAAYGWQELAPLIASLASASVSCKTAIGLAQFDNELARIRASRRLKSI